MKKLTILLALFLACAAPIVRAADKLEMQDVVSGKYAAQRVYGVNPLLDGEHYAQISNDGKRIVKYSFKDGKEVGTIFDVTTARNVKLDSFDGYIMSPDESRILIQTNTRPIYRRSFTAEYYIYSVRNNTLEPLSKNGPQQVPLFSPDGNNIAFVRDITYWLSISGRAYQFIDGLICTEDLLYFLIVIVLFISLSILKLRAGRSKVSRVRSWGTYTAVVAAAFFVGYLSTLPSLKFYYDCTATKSNTLTRTSQDIVKKLDGGLTITTYVNLLEPNYGSGLPSQLKFDVERFEQYLRFKPEIKMRYVYFWDKADNESLDDRFVGLDDRQKAEKMSKILDLDFDMFLTPEEIRKVIDLRPEGNRFVRVIERENGQRSFLRLYDDNQKHPSETEISAALKRFVVKSPKVAFLTGHGMRDIHKTGDLDYNRFAESIYFRYSLINQGFDVLTVDLSREDIPADVDIVVIADMRTPFDEAEGGKLSAYVNRGGNLFILGDYRRQEVMNPVVAPFGVSFLPGVLVEPNDVDLPTLTVGHITAQAAEAFPTYRRPYAYGYTISMPEATALSFDPSCGFTALPVIVSGEKSWTELQTTDFLDQVPTADSLSGERPGSYPTVLALTRQVGDKEQRIVISGDADCVSNYELGKTRNGVNSSNFTLLTGSFKWLSYGEYPLDTTRPEPTDNEIYLGRDSRRWIKYGFAGLLPLALAVCGITIRVRRRRR